jgi:hypothetical protein
MSEKGKRSFLILHCSLSLLAKQSFPRPLIRCLVGLVGALVHLTEACASTRLSAVIGARGGW